MSDRELSRLEVVQRTLEKRLKQREAAVMLGTSERQLRRLVQAYKADGARVWCQSSAVKIIEADIARLEGLAEQLRGTE